MKKVKVNDVPVSSDYTEIMLAADEEISDLEGIETYAAGSVAYKVNNGSLAIYILTPDNTWEAI